MDKDFYDSIMPNIYIPDIQIPNMSALEPAFAAANMIAQSINISGINDALTTVASIADSVNIGTLDGIYETTSMIADVVDTSAITEIASCTAFESAAAVSTVMSEVVDTATMSSALEVTRTISDSIGNMVNLFAGVGGLVTSFASAISDAMTERIHEITTHAGELIHMMMERLREFAESIITIVFPSRRTQAACIAAASRTTIFNVPPIIIKFRDFSALIRRTYLPHARERGSSDDDDNNLIYLCN